MTIALALGAGYLAGALTTYLFAVRHVVRRLNANLERTR